MSDGTFIVLGAMLFGLAVGISESLKNAKRANAFEKRTEALWMLLSQPIAFRRPGPSDGLVLQLLQNVPRTELERSLTTLGDLIMEIVGTPHKSALRVFVDSTRTVVVYWFGHSNSLALESFSEAEEYVTRRGGADHPSITPPPFERRQHVPATMTIEETLEKHLAFVDHRTGVVRMQTLEDVQAQFERIHQLNQTWRATHDPDELLGSDLRIMLGEEGFAKWGQGWIKRFKKRRSPPKAVARERPRAN